MLSIFYNIIADSESIIFILSAVIIISEVNGYNKIGYLFSRLSFLCCQQLATQATHLPFHTTPQHPSTTPRRLHTTPQHPCTTPQHPLLSPPPTLASTRSLTVCLSKCLQSSMHLCTLRSTLRLRTHTILTISKLCKYRFVRLKY